MQLPQARLASANVTIGSVQWSTVLTNLPAAPAAGQRLMRCYVAQPAVVPHWPKVLCSYAAAGVVQQLP